MEDILVLLIKNNERRIVDMKDITIGDNNTYAVVSPVGATVKKFVHNGENLIFPDCIIDDKRRGGIPICFPFFGKPIADFATIPQHGWLRNQELELMQQSENGAVFRGVNEKTVEYPWLLEYEINIKVHSPGLLVLKLITKRLNDGEYFHAPINPGFHPYFCSDVTELSIAKCLTRIGSDIRTDFKKESEQISMDFPILIKSASQTMSMGLQGDFNLNSQVVLWSDNPYKYFCVEPVLTQLDFFAQTEGKFLAEEESSMIMMYLSI